jgi:hypothetical protein
MGYWLSWISRGFFVIIFRLMPPARGGYLPSAYMREKTEGKYAVIFQVGKHTHQRVSKAAEILETNSREIQSVLLLKMARALNRNPKAMPWVAKLYLEIGEHPSRITSANLTHQDYFDMVRLAKLHGLPLGELATRLVSIAVPFCDFQKAAGFRGAKLKEEIAKAFQIEIAVGFARL